MTGTAPGGWLLAVDTALRGGELAVAVAPDGTLLDPPELAAVPPPDDRAGAAERALVDAVRRLFGRRPGPLLGVVAGRGPGSYTGLRLGVAAALGAAQARGCPLRTVPSLQVTAFRLDPGPHPILVVHPAGRGGHHRQAFRAEGGAWMPVGPAELVPRGEPPLGIGGSARVLVEEGAGAEFPPGRAAAAVRPRSAALARLAARSLWADPEAGPGYDRVHLDYGDRRASPWS